MRTVELPCGERVPAFGIGTWRMGESDRDWARELSALRRALDLKVTLIDTAEMYGDGRAERLVGEAIRGRRDEVFIVSKVYPHNASRLGTPRACERSLERLGTDRIDLYLLHWPGDVPIGETLEAFARLQQQQKIRHYGVSNFDLPGMQELWRTPHGAGVQTNQLLYNLGRRSPEWELLPWLREQRVPVMAYSPLEEGRLAHNRKLAQFAHRHGRGVAEVALAWLLAHDDVIVIPKTASTDRLEQNLRALEQALSAEERHELDELFPPPTGPRPLEML